ncbi:hypothetical protein B0T18DRAFT_404321 [Schizothecium vesticola]|uniref:Fe2OG dioxygenase domain-containing protein n=1 Tax=Schizothecium vesticola TaxID=314040 RepID=A0AA40KB48_9PEZI|nr:hypothetical protein B0T18DRAFT_404321 [Schizothecium vesticola]
MIPSPNLSLSPPPSQSDLSREIKKTNMTQVANIPIIDISDDAQDQAQVARDLVDAAIEHGFIYIKNTGNDIPLKAIDAAFELSKKLFAAPLEEKQSCAIQQNNRGWTAMQYETLDPKNQKVGDLKEAFNFGEFINHKAQQPLPPSIASHESQISAFRDLCYHLTLKLNTLLGIGLQVTPPDFFTKAHLRTTGPSGTTLRLLHYPPAPTPPPPDTMRAGAHSDYGSLTLLFRLPPPNQPDTAGAGAGDGLEILTPSGTWEPVPVCPSGTEAAEAPPILVNVGDLLSYWTGGLLRSTVHRVVFPEGREGGGGERYSIAYFCHPAGGVRGFVGREGGKGSNGGVMTADEHLQMRLKASYLELYKDED